jgi:hypothetical protein
MATIQNITTSLLDRKYTYRKPKTNELNIVKKEAFGKTTDCRSCSSDMLAILYPKDMLAMTAT